MSARSLIALFALVASLAFGKPVPKASEVVIIGAGLSGLGTAHLLKKAGIPYHVLELTPRIGGRVRTVRYERGGETLYADSGMEEYWLSNPAVTLLKELKLKTRSDVAMSSIVLQDKLYQLGDEKPEAYQARLFTAEERAALEKFKTDVEPIVREVKSGRPVRAELLKLKDTAFSAWVAEKKLPPKVSEWIRVSLECEIGTGWDRISAIDGVAEFHIFLGGGEDSVRVIGGNDKFTDALAKSVGTDHVSLNKRVTAVTTKGDVVTVSYLDLETNKNGQITASHVVSTIPLFRIFEVQFDPPLSETKQKAIETQSWGAYFKAHILVPRKAERFWTKDKSSFLPILSDSNLGVIYEGNPDQKGKTKIISLLVTGDYAEHFNLTPLAEARREITASFEKLWPGFAAEIQHVEFYRYHPRAIGAWGVGRSRYDELSEAVRTPENRVYLAGDFTESSHSDGAFISAARVVRQIGEAKKAVARNTASKVKRP